MAYPLQIARRAGANLASAVRRAVAQAALPRKAGIWVVVRLTPAIEDLPPPHLPFAREVPVSLLEVLETLEAAAADPQVDGVLLRCDGVPAGWSKLLSLRRAVERLRESGKPVAVYAESLDAESLLVATAASAIWIPPSGHVLLVGLSAETFFVRGLLDHLDVRPEVIRIGTHKTAGDRLTRRSMSAEDREQLEALVDDLFAELVDGIASGRKLEPATVRELIDRGPYHAQAALEAGLVDACLYPDEVDERLVALSPPPPQERPGPRRVRLVDGSLYHGLRAGDPGWRPLLAGLPRIAYVVARGAIHRGAGSGGIATENLSALLERIRRDEEVRGVVLRLDSPGGDGTASDLLSRAVSLVVREKPVVVSMGDVVASGGYYVAAAADAIFAEAGTVTGSIGVVGGKVDLGGLYRRLGVGRESVERGARAGLLSEARGFTPAERAALREQMAAIYGGFVAHVAEHRSLSVEEVERVAQGRVWSGARARSLGLVDAIGGPLEALRDVRSRAGLRDTDRALVDVLPRLPQVPGLRSLLRLIPRRLGL
ncbi:MAG: signal peptide peptidase SppA [Myxococcota bacterium]